jgi:ABC-type dipeptide/oligopeptide/nickel transport system permease component
MLLLARIGRQVVWSASLLVGVAALLAVLFDQRVWPRSASCNDYPGRADPIVAPEDCAHWACEEALPNRAVTGLWNILTFDFGLSLDQERPVREVLGDVVTYDATLLAVSLLGLAAFVGATATIRTWGAGQRAASGLALVLCAVPTWLFAAALGAALRPHHVEGIPLAFGVGIVYGGGVTHLRGRSEEPLLPILIDKLPGLLSALVAEEIVLGHGGLGGLLRNSIWAQDHAVIAAILFTFAGFCIAARFAGDLLTGAEARPVS